MKKQVLPKTRLPEVLVQKIHYQTPNTNETPTLWRRAVSTTFRTPWRRSLVSRLQPPSNITRVTLCIGIVVSLAVIVTRSCGTS